MGQAIGESITFAIGVAISPVPIIAVVLMLLSKKSGANSLAFAFGWVIGVAGVTAVVIAAAGAIGTGSGGTPSHGLSIVKIVLGMLLLVVGFATGSSARSLVSPRICPSGFRPSNASLRLRADFWA